MISPNLTYTLSFPHPATHYFQVKLQIENLAVLKKQDFLDLKMAVWTPGSYLIREYAKNIESFQVNDGLRFRKINKNTWRIFWGNFSEATLEVQYLVYAFEHSVRTNFVDITHAFINGASSFMYIADYQHIPSILKIIPHPHWHQISTSLKPFHKDIWELKVPNFDILVDSPIEIGNQQIFSFQAADIRHSVAFFGLDDFDQNKISQDLIKIVESATSIFGENPCSDYTFISHFVHKNYGGLEHLDSTALVFSRDSYRQEEGYTQFLSLCAHEYFHLWNVKRLRPAPLGPFDYENENYTTLLWQAEGFTTYFEKIILLKAGLINRKTYLKDILKRIQIIENQAGNKVQSVAESSLDAWIKAYRPNENSINSTVSYYTKGAVIAMLLDILVIEASEGAENLDDVMRFMYQKFYQEENRGFTETEIQSVIEKFTRQSLNRFFEDFIYGCESIDYADFFERIGLSFIARKSEKPDLGITIDKNIITQIRQNNSAYEAGLNVNDELVSIDGKVEDDLNKWLSIKHLDDISIFQIKRDGKLISLPLKLLPSSEITFELKKQSSLNTKQKKYLKKWLRS
jgi:predicted metalloprotease with PDZ domain